MRERESIIVPAKPTAKGKLCGFFCSVYQLREDYGVKAYRSFESAESARQRQSKGFDAGVAPACGDDVFLLKGSDRQDHPDYKFGYVTEVAELLDVPKKWRGWKKWDVERFKELYPDVYEKALAIYPKVQWEFRWANLGQINGKVVFLDWS